MEHPEQFPDAKPVVPKSERRAFYERIRAQCPELMAMKGAKVLPHERMLDDLEHKAKTGQRVPVYAVSKMWIRGDPVRTPRAEPPAARAEPATAHAEPATAHAEPPAARAVLVVSLPQPAE